MKLPFMARPLIFLIQQYMIYFKKAMNREKMHISERFRMNGQEQRVREKNLEKETLEYGTVKIVI